MSLAKLIKSKTDVIEIKQVSKDVYVVSDTNYQCVTSSFEKALEVYRTMETYHILSGRLVEVIFTATEEAKRDNRKATKKVD